MPANWLYMDANFPNFNGDESTEDKLAQLQNYLYMLVEQMRYTTQNLDTTNMNQTALAGWENTLTQPIYAQIEGVGERITQLSVTADGLTATVANQGQQISTQEARISNLEVNADSISATVQRVQTDTKESLDSVNQSISELSEKVSLTLTPEQVDIVIDQKLAQGVETVRTSTGFTFDEEGLTVSKTGSEMSTQVTENGMTISRSGTEVLVVDNQGVQATNLNANTFLIIGGKARFEKYGAGRIGCFWIGG